MTMNTEVLPTLKRHDTEDIPNLWEAIELLKKRLMELQDSAPTGTGPSSDIEDLLRKL